MNFQFFKYPEDIKKRIRELKTKPATYWENEAKKYIDKVVQFTLNNVPAYQKFLKDRGINPKSIKNFKDLNKLPICDKNSYLRQYPYEELFPYKEVKFSFNISATSGSTGEPFYFPRLYEHELLHLYTKEIFLLNQWDFDKYNNLVILGFGLGIWIGGILNFEGFANLKRKGYQITTIPVGVSKEQFIRAFKKFAPYFDQVILIGYPPFIKDVLDEGEKEYGVKWKDYRIRILNAAESFPEEFREYMAKKSGLENMLNDNINIYGTVEFGTMAHETAFSNLIRRIAVEKDKVFKAIFPEAKRTPTLTQFHPYITYFEELGGEVIATGYCSAIPLIRYRFPDKGGVISFDDMIKKLRDVGVDIFREAEKWKIDKKILKLPFVYVYERSDSAVSLVGILIYPEYIRRGLLSETINKFVTGKLTMIVKYDKKLNQSLEINVELQKNVKPSEELSEKIKSAVLKSLTRYSTEYNYLYLNASPEYKKQLEPKIILWSYGHEKYFSLKGKHKWSIKQI